MLTVGSLFSGIGGMDLGLERAGMRVEWQVENNEFCREVLKKNWPTVPCHYDITKIDWGYIPRVDLICGGFPCQPFSTASRGRCTAISLWDEMFKAISVIKPTWVLIENVVGSANLALKQVELDLESIGYEVAPPLEIPACAVGCDHWRPRYWVLGYSNRNVQSGGSIDAKMAIIKRVRRRPNCTRATNGVSSRVDRRRAIGNAVVPQIVEALGRMILAAERGAIEPHITPIRHREGG